ncbi:LuxR C-terminal-related transcriptional regulator [Streptomyces iconiensis]|uniref:Helix-turn-helix transcriptional regulator n=1 Tax=Streptomyces iconiensis TaxID=1384038 RepID=A0ABT7A3W1_9ACTN|nr:helix-turn-helix transcriptional regulator [Streptomyces iconiensis]MDJ1136028.1 helix-turn-helix transcriptional regulator [Streptomyces iconiensis]
MTSSAPSRIAIGRAELLSRSAKATDALGMFAEASSQLRRLLPYDAAVWRVTDPVTGMMTAPIRAENLDESGCAVYWETELFTENVNLFRDLARAPVPVAGLRETTGDLPARSTLYRSFMRPRGFQDELRAVLRVGGHPQGHISLFRTKGRAAFDAAETKLIASLLSPLAKQLRSFAEPAPHALPDSPHGPGLLLFSAEGRLLSANDEALGYLDGLPEGPAIASPQGIRVPAWIQAIALKARAVAQERDRGQARARVRNRSGRWLVCHASCLRDADGQLGSSAVVMEPAKSSEIVPLIVDAYELTARETEVTQYIARGLPTGEIAAQLHLSPHTVRDHIKAVFEKVGVSSRGELVGKLFTEYHSPLAEKSTVRLRTG